MILLGSDTIASVKFSGWEDKQSVLNDDMEQALDLVAALWIFLDNTGKSMEGFSPLMVWVVPIVDFILK